MSRETLEQGEWFSYVRNNFAVRLIDLKEIEPGSSLEVLFIDRNFFDTLRPNRQGVVDVWATVQRGGLYTGKYTKTRDTSSNDATDGMPNDLVGTFEWYNLKTDTNSNRIDDPFEFHLCPTNTYYPMHHGFLINVLPPTFERIQGPHYSELPDDSWVGWRGMMVRLEEVDRLPRLRLAEE